MVKRRDLLSVGILGGILGVAEETADAGQLPQPQPRQQTVIEDFGGVVDAINRQTADLRERALA